MIHTLFSLIIAFTGYKIVSSRMIYQLVINKQIVENMDNKIIFAMFFKTILTFTESSWLISFLIIVIYWLFYISTIQAFILDLNYDMSNMKMVNLVDNLSIIFQTGNINNHTDLICFYILLNAILFLCIWWV